MASAIPPPGEMKLTGDLANNWKEFRLEFEDYMQPMGLNEKGKDVQAATLRRVMGSECRHLYKHNVEPSAEQAKDPTVILDAFGGAFQASQEPARYIFVIRTETLKRI